jgi:hypothetical protein
MDTRHVHVDEISVWAWVAASAFALIALAAVILASHDKMRVATDLNGPALPFAEPVLVPPEMIADPRA